MTTEPRVFDPLAPGEYEITDMYSRWLSAIEMCNWGAADQYRAMYLQLLKRHDVRRQAMAVAMVTPDVHLVDSYDCAKDGCPGRTADGKDQCSCVRLCGQPGCHGFDEFPPQ